MRAYLLAAVLLIALVGSAAAQTGRVTGVVKDDHGDLVKGATIIAENPDASPSSFTASTDEKGRFGMIPEPDQGGSSAANPGPTW